MISTNTASIPLLPNSISYDSLNNVPIKLASTGNDESGGNSASPLSGVLNLTNTLLGGGVAFVALPLAVKEISVLPFLVLLCLSAFCNSFTCNLLHKTADLLASDSTSSSSSPPTYFSLASNLGSWSHLVTTFIFLNNLGVCIAFLTIFGDSFPNVTGLDRTTSICAVSAALLLPMVLLKDLHKLRFLSLLSITLCLYFTVLVCTVFTQDTGLHSDLPTPAPPSFLGCLNALASTTLSYTCHYNVLPIRNGLKDKRDIKTVVNYSMLNVTLLFAAVGTLGYWSHPDTTGDILADFNSKLTGVFAVSIALAFTFPLIAFEGVNCALSLLAAISPQSEQALNSSSGYTAVKIAFTLLCCGVAVAVKDTGKFIGVVGSLAGVPIMYIFPCAVFLKVGGEGRAEKDVWGARVGLGLGCVCFVLCTTSSALAFAGIE